MDERSGWAVVNAAGRVVNFYDADSYLGPLAQKVAAEQTARVMNRRSVGFHVVLTSSADRGVASFLSGARDASCAMGGAL